jgi:hypothetical protein
MKTLGVLFCTIALAAIVFSGCSNSSSSLTSPETVGNTAPTIYATVDWTIAQTKILQSIGMSPETTITGSVEVIKSGTTVEDTTATVNYVLHGTAYPLTWSSAMGFFSTTSQHKIPAGAIKNGDVVVVTVKAGSTTYADSAVMPGGVAISADGSSATWATEGNFDELIIYPLGANDIFTTPAAVSSVEGLGGMAITADLNSPVSIPQTALTSGQWYEAEVLAQQEHIPFAGSSVYSDLHVRQVYLKDFQKP